MCCPCAASTAHTQIRTATKTGHHRPRVIHGNLFPRFGSTNQPKPQAERSPRLDKVDWAGERLGREVGVDDTDPERQDSNTQPVSDRLMQELHSMRYEKAIFDAKAQYKQALSDLHV